MGKACSEVRLKADTTYVRVFVYVVSGFSRTLCFGFSRTLCFGDSRTLCFGDSRTLCFGDSRTLCFGDPGSAGRQALGQKRIRVLRLLRTSWLTGLMGQGVWAQLEMRGERARALACFDQPRRAIAVGGPEAAALPAGARIVDAPVETFRVEPQRIRYAQDDHLSVFKRDQAV